MPDPSVQFLSRLGENGPWAAAFAFMLWKVLQAWQADRQTTIEVIRGIPPALEALRVAIDRLADRDN